VAQAPFFYLTNLSLLGYLQNYVQIKIVFQKAVQRFKQAGIPEPELEVSLLLSHTLAMARTAVLLHGERNVDDAQFRIFEKNVARRLAREPLAYITGKKEFWSLPFKVSKDVLIPRPETEFLLERTFDVLKNPGENPHQAIKILDLGTGSGVIAIVVALELVASKVTAIDLSCKALQVALHNAQKYNVAERIDFVNCNWFDGIAANAEFDVIISNPPYIAKEVIAKPFGKNTDSLQPEVRDFEPCLALDGGMRGVQEIRRIILESVKVLKPCGWFFMEIGADQRQEVFDIIRRSGAYSSIKILKDYAGLPRVLQARKI
jgi:release factor glutamine methyltransferase